MPQNVSLRQRRAAVTLVATICDDTGIQPRLPQFIVTNDKVVSAADVASLRGRLEPNVHVVRRSSAWVNGPVMATFVRAYARALKPFRASFQPILVLDACGVHMTSAFLRALARAKIWPLFVPASLTWLMQPCDTHCFALLKRFLCARYHEAQLQVHGRRIAGSEMIEHMSRAVRAVLQGRRWSPAFVGNGLCAGQKNIRTRVLRETGWCDGDVVPNTLPTLDDFYVLFPQRRHPPLEDLLACFTEQDFSPTDSESDATTETEDSTVSPVRPWRERLRPRNRTLHRDEPFEAQAPEPPESDAPPLPPPPCQPTPPVPPPALVPRRVPVGRPLLPRSRRSHLRGLGGEEAAQASARTSP